MSGHLRLRPRRFLRISRSRTWPRLGLRSGRGEALELLRVYDPERATQVILQVLTSKNRPYLTDIEVSAPEFVDVAEADELLMSNVQRYVEQFKRGGKLYRPGRGPAPRVWARYLIRTVEVAVGRRLLAIVPHLKTIVLRHEPVGVKLACVNGLVALEPDKGVWSILVKLLNDPSPSIRRTCAKFLSRVKQ